LDKVLGLYNVKTVRFTDGKGVVHEFSYTSKMRANDIFIEYSTLEIPDEEEDDEDDFKEDLEEEEEDFDEEKEPEYGSQLSVVMKQGNKYYQFLMYHDCFEIGFPVILTQTILFLIKLIEEVDPAQLVEYLIGISPHPLIPDKIPEKDFKRIANKMLKLKIQTIQNLIQEDTAGHN